MGVLNNEKFKKKNKIFYRENDLNNIKDINIRRFFFK